MAKGKDIRQEMKDRQQYVVKANELIRKTRYDLTAQQQKVLLYCISKIQPGDSPLNRYEININELGRACGLRIDDSGYYYTDLKKDLKYLATPEWCKLPDKTEILVSWISKAVIVPLNSTVYIKFDEDVYPYLFDLKERYTQYRLQNVLVFKGKYTIRLYEIMRSYTTQHNIDDDIEKDITLSIQELRDVMNIKGYKVWGEFERRIIRPAITEINNCADDIHVEYEPMRGYRTRAIERINFIITSARAKQQLNALRQRKQRLDHITY